MSRKYNGTSDKATVTLNLSAFSKLSISLWLWQDAFSNGNGIGLEFGSTTIVAGGFGVAPNNSTSSKFAFGMATGSVWWYDAFTRPSAAAWHHYLLTMDRAGPTNVAYLDGAPQTLSTTNHGAGTYGSFGNLALNFMCRNGGSLFNAGRQAELAMWGGVLLGANHAKALAAGACPVTVAPDSLVYYAPMLGDNPEPDYSGKRQSATLTGTTVVAHPMVQSLMRALGRYSFSG